MRKSFFIVLSLILALALGTSHSALALEGQIRLEDAELVLRLGDGRVLRRDGLIGLKLILGAVSRTWRFGSTASRRIGRSFARPCRSIACRCARPTGP